MLVFRAGGQDVNMRDQGFYVQMHLHTDESSRCARVGERTWRAPARRRDTTSSSSPDHFFNANTCVPYDMPWDEQVKGLIAGYRAAKARGDQIGLHVLPGWETYTDGPEYLTYGLGEEFLLHNRDIAILPKKQYLKARCARPGGYITHAHPSARPATSPISSPTPSVWTRWRCSTAPHGPVLRRKGPRLCPALPFARHRRALTPTT